MLPKPGGAVMKPDDWYCIWGAQQQVEKGDNPDEKPMWAHHGGRAGGRPHYRVNAEATPLAQNPRT
jgi:hypothetical protein